MNENTQERQEEIQELGIEGLKAFKRNVKFGDTVINGYASKNNPGRVGFFVKMGEKHIICTDGKGYFYRPVLDTHSKLKIASPAAPAYPRWVKASERLPEGERVFAEMMGLRGTLTVTLPHITFHSGPHEWKCDIGDSQLAKIEWLDLESPSPEGERDAEKLAREHADKEVPHADSNDAPYYTSSDRWQDKYESYIAGYNAALTPSR